MLLMKVDWESNSFLSKLGLEEENNMRGLGTSTAIFHFFFLIEVHAAAQDKRDWKTNVEALYVNKRERDR